jgi:hypothetical protein
MTEAELEARLRLLEAYAPRLRAAGVQHLNIADVSAVLLAPDPTPLVVVGEDDKPKSLMDSPETYGLPEDAEVPGFRRPED